MAGGTAGMQFRILGPLEIESDGERIELAGAAQRALLAPLAPRRQPRGVG